MCRLRHSFFGLTPDDKLRIHEELLSLCYYTNGGISHTEAYNMPIYLRMFNLRTLAKLKEKESPKGSKNSTWEKEDVADATTQGIQNRKMLRNLPA